MGGEAIIIVNQDLNVILSKNKFVYSPKKIFGSLKKAFIVRVAAGENHSLALSNEGIVHGWGSNTKAQLGFNIIDSLAVHKPIELQ